MIFIFGAYLCFILKLETVPHDIYPLKSSWNNGICMLFTEARL